MKHLVRKSLVFVFISPLKAALFLHFSNWVLGGLPRLGWSQKSCSVSLFLQLLEYLRTSRKWKSISLGLSGSVKIEGHAMAKVLAEAPTGMARVLLYCCTSSGALFPLSITHAILSYLSSGLTRKVLTGCWRVYTHGFGVRSGRHWTAGSRKAYVHM